MDKTTNVVVAEKKNGTKSEERKMNSFSYSLCNLLNSLTKKQLDQIRRRLDLKGLSSLNKKELVMKLEEFIPTKRKKILQTLDQERYSLLKEIYESRFINAEGLSPSKLEMLTAFGLVFPVVNDNKTMLTMPMDMIDTLEHLDHAELDFLSKRNDEWIQLMHGLLYYYGAIETPTLLAKISSFSNYDVKNKETLLNVLLSACDYHQEAYYDLHGFVNYQVADPNLLRKEQIQNKTLSEHPFTKEKILEVGIKTNAANHPEMNKLLDSLVTKAFVSNQKRGELAYQLFVMINKEEKLSVMIDYLKSIFEDSLSISDQQLLKELTQVRDNTRMWKLKGNTLADLRQKKKGLTQLLNGISSDKPQISLVSNKKKRLKIGRNQPCPCGSGIKYKKCCSY